MPAAGEALAVNDARRRRGTRVVRVRHVNGRGLRRRIIEPAREVEPRHRSTGFVVGHDEMLRAVERDAVGLGLHLEVLRDLRRARSRHRTHRAADDRQRIEGHRPVFDGLDVRMRSVRNEQIATNRFEVDAVDKRNVLMREDGERCRDRSRGSGIDIPQRAGGRGRLELIVTVRADVDEMMCHGIDGDTQ